MDKIKRSGLGDRHKSRHPFLKVLLIAFLCVVMIGLGFLAAGALMNIFNLL